jgi:hypothetical protein
LERATLPNLSYLPVKAFKGCTNLNYLYIPNVTSLGANCFNGCEKLTNVELPSVTTIGLNVFEDCGINLLHLPKMDRIGSSRIQKSNIEIVYLPNCSIVYKDSIADAYNLKAFIIGKSNSICQLAEKTFAFGKAYNFTGEYHQTYNPKGTINGAFYVPDSEYSKYRANLNWASNSNIVKKISELPNDLKAKLPSSVRTELGI